MADDWLDQPETLDSVLTTGMLEAAWQTLLDLDPGAHSGSRIGVAVLQVDALARLRRIAEAVELPSFLGEIDRYHRAGLLRPPFSRWDLTLARERFRAEELWNSLVSLAPEEWEDPVLLEEGYLRWGLVVRLCEGSRKAAGRQPAEAARLAELADLLVYRLAGELKRRLFLQTAGRLPEAGDAAVLEHLYRALGEEDPHELLARAAQAMPGQFEHYYLPSLRALVAAHRANAARVRGDLHEAERCMTVALGQWPKGQDWEDDVLGAEPVVLSLLASLRRAQRRLPEALHAVERVESYFVAHRSETPAVEWARLWTKKSSLLAELDEWEKALESCDQAELALEASGRSESALLTAIRNNRAASLATLGRVKETLQALEKLGPPDLSDPFVRLHRRWIEGRLAVARGRTREALRAFDEVRRGYLDHGIGYDAALVTLEMAVLHMKRGQIEKTRRLAREVLPIFASLDIARECLVALGLFAAASAQGAMTVRLVQDVHDFVRRARGNPNLAFTTDAHPDLTEAARRWSEEQIALP